MHSFTFSSTLHAFFVSLNTDLLILHFIYVISSFIIKNMYIALSQLLTYIDFNLKHNIYEHCIYDVINLNDNYKHTVNQYYNCCTQKHKHYCNVKYILVEI